MTERMINTDEVPGQASPLSPNRDEVMSARLPDSGSVAEHIDKHPRADFEAARAEYSEGLGALSAGQVVSARHEAVQPLGPQDGPQPPQAPQ